MNGLDVDQFHAQRVGLANVLEHFEEHVAGNRKCHIGFGRGMRFTRTRYSDLPAM